MSGSSKQGNACLKHKNKFQTFELKVYVQNRTVGGYVFRFFFKLLNNDDKKCIKNSTEN